MYDLRSYIKIKTCVYVTKRKIKNHYMDVFNNCYFLKSFKVRKSFQLLYKMGNIQLL